MTEKTYKRASLSAYFRLIVIGVFTVLFIFLIGKWLYHRFTHVSENDAMIDADVVAVSSRLAGWVTEFHLIKGDRLKRGDVVARLYSLPDAMRLKMLQAKVARLEAQMLQDEEELMISKAQTSGGTEEARRQLATDQAAMQEAKANLLQAEQNYHRAEALYQKKFVSAQQRDDSYYGYLAAKEAFRRAENQVHMDRIAIENAKLGVLTTPMMLLPNPRVVAARSKVTEHAYAEALAELEQQQVTMKDLVIRSPIDGVVDEKFIDDGEYITPGQPIIMMHNPDEVWVEAKVKETKVGKMKNGQPVAIHVDAFPDIKVNGHVWRIGHAATNRFALLPDPNPSGNFTKITQRIPVRIAIDTPNRTQLSPGMMVTIDVDIRHSGKEPEKSEQNLTAFAQ